jgi:cytochrome c551/c552
MISKLQRAMKLRPTFYHAFFIFAFAALLASCAGSEEPEQLTIPQSTPAAKKGSDIPEEVNKLLTMHTCLGCHRLDKKLVGPTFKDIAARGYTAEEMVYLMQVPQPENWPDYPPMASMSFVAEGDLLAIAEWITEIPVE